MYQWRKSKTVVPMNNQLRMLKGSWIWATPVMAFSCFLQIPGIQWKLFFIYIYIWQSLLSFWHLNPVHFKGYFWFTKIFSKAGWVSKDCMFGICFNNLPVAAADYSICLLQFHDPSSSYAHKKLIFLSSVLIASVRRSSKAGQRHLAVGKCHIPVQA